MAPSSPDPTRTEPDPDQSPTRYENGVPITSKEVLYARWEAAVVAPWVAGYWTKRGGRLYRTLTDVVQRVAMIDEQEIQENWVYELVDAIWGETRERIVTAVLEGKHARSGLHGISEEGDAAAALRMNGGWR